MNKSHRYGYSKPLFYDVFKLKKLIEREFNASYMSNTKWEKLIDGLSDIYQDHTFVYYKLVHEEAVRRIFIDSADYMPFFCEPIIYKEVEWIEFPAKYEALKNQNNRKAGMTSYTQDLEKLKTSLNQIGKYVLQESEEAIRLYGYKRIKEGGIATDFPAKLAKEE